MARIRIPPAEVGARLAKGSLGCKHSKTDSLDRGQGLSQTDTNKGKNAGRERQDGIHTNGT